MDLNIPLFVKNEQLGDIQTPCNTVTFSKKLYTQACQKPFMFRSPKLRFSTAEISIELQSNYRRGRLGSRLPSPSGRHSPARLDCCQMWQKCEKHRTIFLANVMSFASSFFSAFFIGVQYVKYTEIMWVASQWTKIEEQAFCKEYKDSQQSAGRRVLGIWVLLWNY